MEKVSKFEGAKKAYHFLKNTPGAASIAAHIGGGTAIGSIGGYSGHHAFNSDVDKKKPKSRTHHTIRGAASGALIGTLQGIQHHISAPKLNEPVVRAIKEKLRASGKKFYDVHRQVGTAAGAALGGVVGYKLMERTNKERKAKGKKTQNPIVAALLLGGLGASHGHSIGSLGRMFQVRKAQRHTAIPSWLKGVKTKAEAKSKYREQAHKHHPDKNPGNKEAEERFKTVSKEWEDFETHHLHKLSHSMFQELFRIVTGV